jgi:hypothetical protein
VAEHTKLAASTSNGLAAVFSKFGDNLEVGAKSRSAKSVRRCGGIEQAAAPEQEFLLKGLDGASEILLFSLGSPAKENLCSISAHGHRAPASAAVFRRVIEQPTASPSLCLLFATETLASS